MVIQARRCKSINVKIPSPLSNSLSEIFDEIIGKNKEQNNPPIIFVKLLAFKIIKAKINCKIESPKEKPVIEGK